MGVNKYLEAFGKPFDKDSVKWRLQYIIKEKMGGYAVPYLDSRAIADRLDEVVGQMNWQDSYTPWHEIKEGQEMRSSQLCTISIYNEELKTWINKTDGAGDTDIEPVKGGLSDAFKRAAAKWNIGRYMYKFKTIWVEIEQSGKSLVIKDSEMAKLDKYYIDTVARLFNNAPQKQEKPKQTPKDVAPTSASTPELYVVSGVKTQPGKDGTDNCVVSMTQNDKKVTAYLKGTNSQIKAGSKLKNVKLLTKEGSYGPYNIMEKYELAA